MIVIMFGNIISIFLNARICITHNCTNMSSLQHFNVVLRIPGCNGIFNRYPDIITEPSDRKAF